MTTRIILHLHQKSGHCVQLVERQGGDVLSASLQAGDDELRVSHLLSNLEFFFSAIDSAVK